ncbi:MAG: hypothetical protein JWN26_667 [Candidatus Saccharibacteria bacterium]|nr:hypothetical protein [Candidatus Saccharibacteria bacterium]
MDSNIAQAVYNQAFKNWINPEVLARQKRGEVELPLKIHSAQILFGIDGSHTVRINEETKGTFTAKLKRAVKKGELLTYNDVDGLYLQQAPEDKGFGYITVVAGGDNRWSVSFSFEYGVDRIKEYLSLGEEYLENANDAVETSKRVATALGMTAGENLVKARLASSPLVDVSIMNARNHSQVFNRFKLFATEVNLKKLDKAYIDAVEFFKDNFNTVRYNTSKVEIHKSTLKKHLAALGRLKADTRRMVNSIDVTSLSMRQVKINEKN